MTMRTLPPRKTLAGNFDAYCHVCWNAVYVLWVDASDDPAGACMFGHTKATDCPDAMAAAQNQATLAKLRRDGLLPPLAENFNT